MELGFRSSFNFIPEGPYDVPASLRAWLTQNGFEVGVHDLHHDGRLFQSRAGFRRKAKRINAYLHSWQAVGHRAGFMLRELDWIHDLNVQYDASTFDTDPFEPQPDGANTIFPFRVSNDSGGSYVELPYTLPQDSTIFLLLREQSTTIWTRKLDWIARMNGMALMNTHPDYMDLNAISRTPLHFPITWYAHFLQDVKSRFAGTYWHSLPRDVARHLNTKPDPLSPTQTDVRAKVISPNRRQRNGKIWIDLENTPHIPFFVPIIRELESLGYQVVLTARRAFQTCEMAERQGLKCREIGSHYGRNRFLKILGLGWRATQLLPFILRERPTIALNHGARAQILACNLLRIPSVMVMDYEHSSSPPMVRPTFEIVPDVLSVDNLHCKQIDHIRHYRGIKEDVYVPTFRPGGNIPRELGLDAEIIATVRPPAIEAHYHNPEAELLFDHFMNRLCATANAQAVLLPRNKAQETSIRSNHPEWFSSGKVVVPQTVVDGLNLLWHSDLVVSGGGTMNREAAALGIPVYSIFRGKIGAVDRALQASGRLIMIESTSDVDRLISVSQRARVALPSFEDRHALADIVRHIDEIISSRRPTQS